MFNKLLNRIANPEQTKSPTRSADSDGLEKSQSAEGFICPQCLLAFPTAEKLQNHYESAHQDNVGSEEENGLNLKCSACKMKFGTERELKDHYSRHHSSDDMSEVDLLKSQIHALEEGKLLTSSEILLLRKQLSESMESNSSLRHEKDKLQRRATVCDEEMSMFQLQIEEQKKKFSLLETKLKKCEEMKRELEVQLQQRAAADDVTVLRQELVSVQKLMDKNILEKEAEKESLQKDYCILQEKITSLEEQKHILEEALKKVPQKEEMERLRRELLESTAKTMELQKIIAENENKNKVMIEKYEKIEKTLEDKQKECSQLEISIKEEKKKYNNMKNSKDQQIKDMQKDISEVNQKLLHLQEECQNLIKERENAKSHSLETKKQLEEYQRHLLQGNNRLKELEVQLNSSKDTIARLESERTELCIKIEAGEGTNTALQQLQQENDLLRKKLKEQQESERQNLKQIVSKYETVCQQNENTKVKLHNLEEECQNYKTTIDKLNAQLLNSQSSFAKLQEENQTKETEFQAELKENKNEQTRLKCLLEKETEKFLELKAQMDQKEIQQKSEIENLNREKQELMDQISARDFQLKEIEKEIVNVNNRCLEIQKSANNYKEELHLIHNKFEDATNKLNKCETERQNLLLNMERLKEEMKNMREVIDSTQLNEKQLMTMLDNIKELNKELNQKVQNLELEITKMEEREIQLKNENVQLDSELKMTLHRLSEITETNSELEHSLNTIQKSYQQETEKKNMEIAELNNAKQLLINQKLSLQNEIDHFKEESIQMEASHQEEVQQLQEYLKELKLKMDDAEKKLKEEVNLKQQLNTEWQMCESKYDAEISVLNENLSTLKEDLCLEQSRRENLERKADELKVDNLELEAKLENALDERRALLERCLKSEGECERLQETTIDLRHKLDDTMAALQELGRENQTLQIENTKHQNRKWTDDAEVTHCTLCMKQFTVTIRKHHCRNCGNIFCNECSSKTAIIAVSKKPVRVCNNCYGEVVK